MTRLFVAAWPDAATVERLRAIDWPDEPGVRRLPETSWHVTLRFIGDADPATVTQRLQHTSLPSADAVLGPEVERLGDRQIVVPVRGVDDLAAAVRSATAPFGRDNARPFRGHLTIARTRRHASRQLPGNILGTPITARFAVDEVALVSSDLQPTGAVYRTIATFPVSFRD